MKKIVTFIAFLSLSIFCLAQGPYDPPANQLGSDAIHKDSSTIVSWASGAEINRGYIQINDTSIYESGSNKASFGYRSLALGQANGNSTEIISLGDSGIITLSFDYPIINGPGNDFVVFENALTDDFLELAFVEVSSDGHHFFRFPSHSLTQDSSQIGSFGALDATNLKNLAGKYRQGYGVGFDLNELSGNPNLDLNNVRLIRIIDVIGCINNPFASYDAFGNKINDPWPTPFNSSGFDLDAIGVINQGDAFSLSNIDEIPLAIDSYWNGSDLSAGFSSGLAYFNNEYDTSYFSWSGFSYSNMRDDSTTGWTNQYSVICAGGIHAPDSGGTNYVTAYIIADYMSPTYDPIPNIINWTDSSTHLVSGFYACNSTQTYLSMLNGDAVAKQFGGISGNDPDYFKLLIWGIATDSSITDTIEFYLADFRFTDNNKDYLVKDWQWVDLLELGEIIELFISVESSDVGTYGINTPTYFCMDNLTVYPGSGSTNLQELSEQNNEITVYPNPCSDQFKIRCNSSETFQIDIFNMSAKLVYHEENISNNQSINISFLDPGIYIINILNAEFSSKELLIID